VLNPKNGIPVKAFKQAQQTRHEDDELIHLKEYLMKVLIHTDDVTKVKFLKVFNFHSMTTENGRKFCLKKNKNLFF
jgi:capsule polysaccharide export protein KpsE/RkpR